MKNIDIAIYDIDKVICKSIENNSSDLGYLSQSILSHLRNYVEHIGMKYYFESVNEDMTNSSSNIYNEIQMGIDYFKKHYKLNWLKIFMNYFSNLFLIIHLMKIDPNGYL